MILTELYVLIVIFVVLIIISITVLSDYSIKAFGFQINLGTASITAVLSFIALNVIYFLIEDYKADKIRRNKKT